MYTKRIIPCLDVKSGRVVKGTNFVGLRDAGDPVELAARYDMERADELVFLDSRCRFCLRLQGIHSFYCRRRHTYNR